MNIKWIINCSVLACLLAWASAVDARLYRWVDDQGRVHYSDQVPPEQSKKGHEVLDKKGIKLDEVAPEKTRDQLIEERRKQAIQAEKDERMRLIRERDEMLLRTFTRVEDLDRVINDRLTVLDSIINITQAKVNKLLGQLKAAEERKINYIKQGKTVPEQLTRNIVELRQQIKNNEGLVVRNQRRKELIKQKFALDRTRFLELVKKRERIRQETAKEF
ncbi:MAG TPA: DUF4124 domain-containing protein [Chromatiales bacterium]|nr:DUF4124 domain-containing protein [Thiotrichales bacterium]HIP68371.1 DUF4124 domain-containing protein [Chromatiales bacterium]